MRRFLDEVDVMNVPCRMELRHEECVHVPEFCLDKRTPHFLESHAHEFCLHGIEKLTIGMPFAGAIRGARRLIVYLRKRFVRQLPSFNSSGVSWETSSTVPCRESCRVASIPVTESLSALATRSSIRKGSRVFPRLTAWS